MILGGAHVAIHPGLAHLLADGIVGRVSHGTAHLPSSRRYYPTAKGVGEAAGVLGFDTASDFVRAYPVSREWLALLIRRMDAVASVYRLAASLSLGTDGLRVAGASIMPDVVRANTNATMMMVTVRVTDVINAGD